MPAPEPFLSDDHRALREKARALALDKLEALDEEAEHGDVAAAARRASEVMASRGLYRHAVADPFSVRAVLSIREGLAYGAGLADALFALQGLGSLPIRLAGSEAQRDTWLPRVADGSSIAGFAMTEPGAGSDPAGMTTSAVRDGDDWVLSGEKTLISNAGIAGHYTLFAKTDPDAGTRGISCFLVPGDASGLTSEPLRPMAAHPLGNLHLDDVRLPADALLGDEGRGYALALATLDRMRPTVAAAACGFAWRAMDEAVVHANRREQFGAPIAERQGLRWMLADAATDLDAARLLVYRAGWLKDEGAERITVEGAQAKLFATEAAQRIVDTALQVHGGSGAMRGAVVERLYREVRALRIYEGTSEVLRDVVGRGVLSGRSA